MTERFARMTGRVPWRKSVIVLAVVVVHALVPFQSATQLSGSLGSAEAKDNLRQTQHTANASITNNKDIFGGLNQEIVRDTWSALFDRHMVRTNDGPIPTVEHYDQYNKCREERATQATHDEMAAEMDEFALKRKGALPSQTDGGSKP